MSLTTRSQFFYGHTIDESNYALDFAEGSGVDTLGDGIVGAWEMEGLTDLVGTRTLSEFSTTTDPGGIFGVCRSLDGTGGIYYGGVDVNWGISNAFAVSVWAKQDAADASKVVFQFGDNISAGASNFRLSAGSVKLLNGSGTLFKHYTGIPTSTNWTHYVVTWDGSALKVYVNGVDITAGLTKVVDNTGTMTNVDRLITIGYGIDLSAIPEGQFDGLIDETAFWGRALTAPEAAALYNGGSGVEYPFPAGDITTFAASVPRGSYSLEEFAAVIASTLNTVGDLTYEASVDRETRKITISADGVFQLLVSSGDRIATGVWDLLGFTGADRTDEASYEGDSASGSVYRPQFVLQDHMAKDFNRRSIDPVVNKSASGITEVVRFGTERMVRGNIKYITDIDVGDGSTIEVNATGVDDALAFMNYITEKKPFEYMPDRDDPSVFDKVILESTNKSQQGTDYELKELYDQGLPGFYETGSLTMRVMA